jgi:hypothetical protein
MSAANKFRRQSMESVALPCNLVVTSRFGGSELLTFSVFRPDAYNASVLRVSHAKNAYQSKQMKLCNVGAMEKTPEDRIRELFSKHSFPPMEVIIPVLQKAGKGEQELEAQLYNAYVDLAGQITEILGLKEKNMKTMAKVWGIIASFEGIKIQPIHQDESKFSFSLSDCPMVHVRKDISYAVKSKFCDLICNSASRALRDAVFDSEKAALTWNKALIKGAGKCTITFELV